MAHTQTPHILPHIFEKLIRIDFERKPVYGDDDKYIMLIIRLKIFTIKRCLKKNDHASFYQ